jgi:valyl-tRNA synthetase
MPPPNVTGYLHMGHAMFVALQVLIRHDARFFYAAPVTLCGMITSVHLLGLVHTSVDLVRYTTRLAVIGLPPYGPLVRASLKLIPAVVMVGQDILARFHRMRGRPTLWLPGTDHAGIATQLLVERALAKEVGSKRLGAAYKSCVSSHAKDSSGRPLRHQVVSAPGDRMRRQVIKCLGLAAEGGYGVVCVQGIKRQELGREKFLERVWEWKKVRRFPCTHIHRRSHHGDDLTLLLVDFESTP